MSCLELNCFLVIYCTVSSYCVTVAMKLSILVLCLAFAGSFGKFSHAYLVYGFILSISFQLHSRCFTCHLISYVWNVLGTILKVLMA